MIELIFQVFFAVLIIYLSSQFFFKKQVGKKGNTIFIVGESGSGKTQLLYKLCNKQEIQTVSSLQINETTCCQKQVVDIPGHGHMRQILFDRMKETKIILLVIDSANKASLVNVADYIYSILTHNVYIENQYQIVLVCNKIDLPDALSESEIKSEIIKEIERIKLSKKAISEDKEDFDDFIKNQSKEFNFSDHEIKFTQISIKQNQLQKLQNILQSFDCELQNEQ